MSLDIEKYREKRSLDSNAYCWVLFGKLSEKLQIPPKDIYRSLIPDVGGNSEVVPIRKDAVSTWRRNWEDRGAGWVTESLGESKLPGYENIINYYGSSTYNSAQMARLIDLAIELCKENNIETATPLELARMQEEWEGHR